MPHLLRAVALVCGLLLGPVHAQGPAAFTGLTPPDDGDLAAVVAALAVIPDQPKLCERTSCAEFSCEAMNALFKALGTAEAVIAVSIPALEAAIADYRKLLDQFEKDYEAAAESEKTRRMAKALAEVYLQAGRLLMDLASFGSAASSLPKLLEKATVTDNVQDIVALIEYTDAIAETASGSANVADDLFQVIAGENVLTGRQAKALVVKSAFSDAYGAIKTFREKLGPVRTLVAAGASAETVKKARTALIEGVSTAGVAQLVGKLLIPTAEEQIRELTREVTEDALTQEALNQAFETNYRPFARLIDREVAMKRLQGRLRAAIAAITKCDARCPGWTGVAPDLPTAGMSYGEVLKKYSPLLAPAVKEMTAAIKAIELRPGTTPALAALPRVVSPSDAAAARYSLAQCPATERAQLRLLERNGSFRELGAAKSGTDLLISFAAPAETGDYDLRLVDSSGASLVSVPFVVEQSKPEEDLGCGVKLAKGIAGSRRDGHLAGKSLSFAFGVPSDKDYTAGQMTIMPAVACSGGRVYFTVFGGVSKESEFFKIEMTAGDRSTIKYPEQWVYEVSVGFDTGAAVSYNPTEGFAIPDGAKRVDYLRMHILKGAVDTELVWGNP